MLLRQVTPPDPANVPVTLQTAKDHLRVEHGHEDSLIALYIRAATSACERAARISYMLQVWEATYDFPRYCGGDYMDRFSYMGEGTRGDGFGLFLDSVSGSLNDPDGVNSGVRLHRAPISGITSVTVTGREIDPVTIGTDLYTLTTDRLAWNDGFREASEGGQKIAVRYVAGAANAAALEPSLQLALLMTLTVVYEHRGLSDVTVPPAARALLNNFWTSPVGGG